MRRRIRSALVAVAAAAALALLSGCVTIPTGGGVTTVQIAENANNGDTVRRPTGPEKGMSPAEIVAGFVRAGGAPQSNYEVAREFLADSLSSKWKPNDGITLSDSQIVPASANGPDQYRVSLDVVGQIDSSGVYTSQSDARRDLGFHVVRQRGQWRIDQAPDGTVLSTRDLGGAVKPYDLYFFDPSYDYLVPDLRWFADQGGAGYVYGRIVSALLAGPAKWLASPILVSAFPGDTKIGGTPVIDDAGTLTVDLASSVLDTSAAQQARMQQQLSLSLRLPDVRGVTMTANGLSVPVTGQSDADSAPTVLYDAIGSDGKTFGSVRDNGVTSLAGLGSAVQALAPTGASLGRDRASVAVRGTGGVSLVTPNGHAVVDGGRPNLVRPSLDPLGYVWSAQPDPASLIAVRADGRPHAMPIAVDGTIVSLAMSRDGTRLLVGLSTDGGPRAIVLGVQRDKDGAPTGFGPPLDVPLEPGGPVIDAAWVDAGTVAVLTGVAGAADDVTEYELSGRVTPHDSVEDGVQLAAGSGGSGFEAMRVLLRDGELLRPSVVEGWQSTGEKLSFLGVQQ